MRSRRRSALAILATVLYAVTAVGVPLLHATTEVVRAEQGIEAEHSDTCSRIHRDVSCPSPSGHQLPRPAIRHVPTDDTSPHRPVAGAVVLPLPRADRETAPPVRAPPQS